MPEIKRALGSGSNTRTQQAVIKAFGQGDYEIGIANYAQNKDEHGNKLPMNKMGIRDLEKQAIYKRDANGKFRVVGHITSEGITEKSTGKMVVEGKNYKYSGIESTMTHIGSKTVGVADKGSRAQRMKAKKQTKRVSNQSSRRRGTKTTRKSKK